MPKNRRKEVEDFIAESGVKLVLARSQCEVKYERTASDFEEYLRWVPMKFDANGKYDMDQMVVDYFSADDKHYFEIVREIEHLNDEADHLEVEVSERE